MTVAGIDLSTHAIDVVAVDEDTDAATWHRFPLSGHDAFERARDVWPALLEGGIVGLMEDVVACGIEQPRGHHGTVHIARVQGAVLASLPRRLLVQPWNPSEWRKACGLPGNASKRAVWEFVIDNEPDGNRGWSVLEDWPQDACDAYCIALATRSLLHRSEAAA